MAGSAFYRFTLIHIGLADDGPRRPAATATLWLGRAEVMPICSGCSAWKSEPDLSARSSDCMAWTTHRQRHTSTSWLARWWTRTTNSVWIARTLSVSLV